jgi:hypothetical protein
MKTKDLNRIKTPLDIPHKGENHCAAERRNHPLAVRKRGAIAGVKTTATTAP